MMASAAKMTIKKVTATQFRDNFRNCATKAHDGTVLLIENRRNEPKYLVDKKWLDKLLRSLKTYMATIEVLTDRQLTERLLRTAETIDRDIEAGRLHTMDEVFGVGS